MSTSIFLSGLPLRKIARLGRFLPVLTIVIVTLFPSAWVFAAEVRFIATPPIAVAGVEVGIDVVLDTEEKTATALSGEVSIVDANGAPVTLTRIRDGGSLIGVWLKEATTGTAGKVSFSGIIPGGRTSVDERVLTLYVVPEQTGTLTFAFSGEVFYSTSPGEPIVLPRTSFSLPVSESQNEVIPVPDVDNSPPTDIRAIITQGTDFFDGKPFIVVHAKDAESGILMYELLEIGAFVPLAGLENDNLLPWQVIDNPSPLLYPVNTRYIYVRVTDREGNAAVAFVGAPNELSPEKSLILFNKWVILAILIGVAGLLSLWLWIRRKP